MFSTNAPTGHLPAYVLLQESSATERTRLNGVNDLIPSVTQRAAFCSVQTSSTEPKTEAS